MFARYRCRNLAWWLAPERVIEQPQPRAALRLSNPAAICRVLVARNVLPSPFVAHATTRRTATGVSIDRNSRSCDKQEMRTIHGDQAGMIGQTVTHIDFFLAKSWWQFPWLLRSVSRCLQFSRAIVANRYSLRYPRPRCACASRSAQLSGRLLKASSSPPEFAAWFESPRLSFQHTSLPRRQDACPEKT